MGYENKLAAEFETISNTDFWKHYEKEIMEFKKGVITNLLTFPIDKIPGLQGQVFAIDRILRLPSNLIEATRNQSKT